MLKASCFLLYSPSQCFSLLNEWRMNAAPPSSQRMRNRSPASPFCVERFYLDQRPVLVRLYSPPRYLTVLKYAFSSSYHHHHHAWLVVGNRPYPGRLRGAPAVRAAGDRPEGRAEETQPGLDGHQERPVRAPQEGTAKTHTSYYIIHKLNLLANVLLCFCTKKKWSWSAYRVATPPLQRGSSLLTSPSALHWQQSPKCAAVSLLPLFLFFYNKSNTLINRQSRMKVEIQRRSMWPQRHPRRRLPRGPSKVNQTYQTDNDLCIYFRFLGQHMWTYLELNPLHLDQQMPPGRTAKSQRIWWLEKTPRMDRWSIEQKCPSIESCCCCVSR